MVRYARSVAAVASVLFVLFVVWKLVYHNGQSTTSDSSNTRKEDKVIVSVFYESLCPDSVKFVREELWPTYDKLKDHVFFDLVPFGKASFRQNGDDWTFQCQHGPPECLGNKLQACAVKLFPDQHVLVPFVHCVMTSEYPPSAGEKCSNKVGISWQNLSSCFNGSEGNDYLHDMGVRTKSLQPSMNFVPWININNKHTDEIQDQAMTNLLGLVCRNFKDSEKPPQCS